MSGSKSAAAQAKSRDSIRARSDAALLTRIRVEGECWVWTGARQTPRKGHANEPTYGIIQRHKRQVFVHRRVYELTFGPIPAGAVVMHACDNPPCINPAHLSIGTPADNTADMVAKGRALTPVSCFLYCRRGHRKTAETSRIDRYGHRVCLICERERRRETYWRRKARDAA